MTRLVLCPTYPPLEVCIYKKHPISLVCTTRGGGVLDRDRAGPVDVKRRRLSDRFDFLSRPLNLAPPSRRRPNESDRQYQCRIAAERAHRQHNPLDLTLDE